MRLPWSKRSQRSSPSLASAATRVGAGSAGRLILLGRIALLVLAAGAVAVAWLGGRAHDRAADNSGARYVCPMHPEVSSKVPGQCPICRMALQRVSTPRRDRGVGNKPLSPSLSKSMEVAIEEGHDVVEVARRRVLPRAMRAPAWVDDDGSIVALLYKDELAALAPKQHGSFFAAGAPSVGIDVVLSSEPAVAWDRSTSRVHFSVSGSIDPLRPREVGWVSVAPEPRPVLVVPYGSILDSSEGPYVLAALPDRRGFVKRPVELGQIFYGFAIVISGIEEQEPLAVHDTFFLDAELRSRSQSGSMGGMMP